jgi:hypothetical protein
MMNDREDLKNVAAADFGISLSQNKRGITNFFSPSQTAT